MREWLILIGVILLVGIVLDGCRRVRKAKKNQLSFNVEDEFEEHSQFSHEQHSDERLSVAKSSPMTQSEINLDESVPVLMESVDVQPQPIQQSATQHAYEDLSVAEEIVPESLSAIDDTFELRDERENISVDSEQPEAEEVIAINVMAKDEQGFSGSELLKVLLSCSLRHGDMGIFHRYDEYSGTRTMFSLANAIEPGIFDLNDIDNLSTPGVILFMGMPGANNLSQAFETMLETSQCIANHLNGELKDERRSVMTDQTVEYCRQRVQDFERRQLSKQH